MEVHIFETEHELLLAYAELFVKTACEAQSASGEFNVVLSGGNSPKKLYELLTSPRFYSEVDWSKINFFIGDERYVPADDAQSNALMIKKTLFEPILISPTQIFMVDTSLSPREAAEKYMDTIKAHFKNRRVQFDLIMLGLGDNAHTASLFPNTPVLSETAATVEAVFLKEQNTYRITMTAPLINQGRHIAFLVFGESKANAVYQVLRGERDIEKYPAQLIHPETGELYFFLDKAAASFYKYHHDGQFFAHP